VFRFPDIFPRQEDFIGQFVVYVWAFLKKHLVVTK